MKKILVVIDMQKDFVDGTLGTKEAQDIVPNVAAKIRKCQAEGAKIIFTRDTHYDNYLETQEGKKLPVKHCIIGTSGHEIVPELIEFTDKIFDKPTFGSLELMEYLKQENPDEVEFVGLCTDICVISNAIMAKANLFEKKIAVDESCCAGVTPQSHKNAIEAMKMCQIDIV